MKPGEIERLSMVFDRKMRELEDEIMTDIVRRIRINSEITRSADWQINRLYELGLAKDDIEKAIKKHLHLSDDEIKELFEEAAKADYVRNAEIYRKTGKRLVPFEENEALRQLVSSVAEQTKSEMQNLSGSLGFAVKGANGKVAFKPAAKYYQDALDKAVTGIATGAFDYNTAIKKAVAELVKSGLRSVDYSSGWSNRVDVAARRAVMTGYSQIVGKINEQNAAELETDTFEVTWHGGARPTHQLWQGKWYTKKELVTVCGLGTVTGLHGANCYHDYYPVVPGVSEPTYTADELREMNAKENIPTEYCGKTYTKYEALQRQRRLETKMRAQRRQIKLLQEGNAAEDDIINARCRYRGTSGEYSRFSKAMGIPQQRERVTVDGLGNIGVGKRKIGDEKMRVDNEEKIDYSKNSDIMKRKKGLNRSDVRFITDKRFNELTIEAKKNGANIVRGSVEVEKHLDFMGADAAMVGDTLLFKRNVCVSEVIEETHHFMQNIQGLNFDKAEPLRTYLNEIEAKEYLLLNREKYNIPRSECETTKKQLAYYKELLEQYRKEQTK